MHAEKGLFLVVDDLDQCLFHPSHVRRCRLITMTQPLGQVHPLELAHFNITARSRP